MSPDADGNFKGIRVPPLPASMERMRPHVSKEAFDRARDQWLRQYHEDETPLDTAESVQADQDTSGPGWPE